MTYQSDCTESIDFSEAKESQLLQWIVDSVYVDVPGYGQKFVTTRWVLTQKESGLKKARLIIRDFQDPDLAEPIKDSPTCGRDSFRILLSVASSFSWFCGILDKKTAFLQGEPLKRVVHVKPPVESGSDQNVLWKLHKCVYGLADAAKHWFERVQRELIATGFKQSRFDICVSVFSRQ